MHLSSSPADVVAARTRTRSPPHRTTSLTAEMGSAEMGSAEMGSVVEETAIPERIPEQIAEWIPAARSSREPDLPPTDESELARAACGIPLGGIPFHR